MPYYGILTAANPKGDLEFVNLEFQKLHEYFDPLHDIVDTIINGNATEAAIFDTFLSRSDIRIFHFSGHAGSGEILMDNKVHANGNILAAMTRYAKHLKLVFLNGCATYDLVDKFLHYGASVVIATKAPVFDKIACDFSTCFYEALCGPDKKSIGDAFDIARQKVKAGIDAKLKEDFPPKSENETSEDYDKRIEETGEYRKALEAFQNTEIARTIRIPGKERPGLFEWAIYQNKKHSPEKQQENENWKLIDETDITPIEHFEPSFDFLKSVGLSVKKLKEDLLKKGLLKNDPRLGIFTAIEESTAIADTWTVEGTEKLISNLNYVLLRTYAKAFREVINHSKDNRDALREPRNSDAKLFSGLLEKQVDLYKKFIRTAVEIMLSDFMETVILVGQNGSEEYRTRFNQALQGTDLPALIKQLIGGEKHLSDIDFDVKLMRNVVVFLKEGRTGLAKEDRKTFRQFVDEYNGNNFVPDENEAIDNSDNYVAEIEAAIANSNHEIAITIINKVTNNVIQQSPLDTLQCYCDRMESALISLFSIHKYLLLYEIITVGKVEAYRRRDRRYISICHDVFDKPLSPAETTTYGMNFAENYSVLIVNHRKKFLYPLDYLSLSPFVIDVGLFNEQPNSTLYLFNGVKENYMEYVDAEEKKTIKINIDSSPATVNDPDDLTFLEISKEKETAGVVNRDMRSDKERSTTSSRDYKKRVRQRFARVRDQFRKVTLLYLLLTRDKKPKATPIV